MKDIKIDFLTADLHLGHKYIFVEDTGDENCTMEELVSFETSPI